MTMLKFLQGTMGIAPTKKAGGSRRLRFEQLERKELLAVDLQGWWVDAPPQATWGTEVALELAQIRNTGNSPSGSFEVEFYLSKDQHGSSDDVLLARADGPGACYQHGSIAGYSKGPEFCPKLKLPTSPPPGFSGSSAYIIMKTDATDKIFETNENNNFGNLGLTYDNDKIEILGATAQKADLSGWWNTVTDNAKWGDVITVESGQIRNTGSGASGTFLVQWYLSRDRYGSSDDILLPLAGGGTWYAHGSIGPNAYGPMFSTTLKLPSAMPAGWSGQQFYVVMKTDALNQVSETNEANNFGQGGETYDCDTIQITGASSQKADLLGWWNTVTDNAKWGEVTTVESGQIRNSGSGASGTFLVQWYLSRDHYGSSDDILLPLVVGGTSYAHGGIGPNAYGPIFSTTLKLPSAMPAGWSGQQFYVVMKTDALNQVNETNEANNFGQGGETYDYDTITIQGAQSGYYKPIPSFPATGGYIGFGYWTGSSYHNGADYATAAGTVVSAVADGDVVISGQYNGFGSLNPSTKGGVIVVKHKDKSGNPFYAVYGHLNTVVSVGAKVTKGQTIGTIAPFYNGGSYLPHLHFGIYVGATFPSSGWGYSSSLNGWFEPKTFLENNL